MMTKDELLNGVPTANYLNEQFSDLSATMEENIKRLINEGSATSQITFDEGSTDPIFHPTLGEKVSFGSVAFERDEVTGRDEVVVYDDEDEFIDTFIYLDYDSQLAVYTAVYNYFKNQD